MSQVQQEGARQAVRRFVHWTAARQRIWGAYRCWCIEDGRLAWYQRMEMAIHNRGCSYRWFRSYFRDFHGEFTLYRSLVVDADNVA
jgi:hypothetical protein